MSALRDIKNNIESDLAYYDSIVGNATLSGYILDTANHAGGIMFSFAAPEYTSGTYTIDFLRHSDDSGMAGAVDIPDNSIIGSKSDIVFTSKTNKGDSLLTLGIIGTKRYVQLKMAGSGTVTLVVYTTKISEYLPIS
jgi:hypothetical protein